MIAQQQTTAAAEGRSPGRVGRCLQAVLRRGFGLVVYKLGTWPSRRAARLSSALSAVQSWRLRKLQRRNFTTLFPRLSPAEICDLSLRHRLYLTHLRVHVARLAHQPTGELSELVVWRGREHLDAALAQGRGVLMVGGHMGTWWHAPLGLASAGWKVSSVVNPLLAPQVVDFMRSISSRFGVTLNYVNQDTYGAAREAFCRNEIFYIAMDRSLRPDRSIWVPLAGAHLPVDPGTAILALRQRPAVLWVTSYHDEKGRPTAELSRELVLGRGTSLDTPESLCHDWGKRLERDLLRWPDQWWPASFSSLTTPNTLPSPSVGREKSRST